MAKTGRPKKLNADFFSHDVDMRNDNKIRALRRKYGHTGYSFFNMILELLGDCDYFEYQWNDINIELLEPDFDLDAEQINEMVQYCVKLNLLQIINGYLTCNKFTDRLMSSLIASRDGFTIENSKRMNIPNTLPSEKSEKTQFPNTLPSENAHSRVEYSKGEESKGEKSKGEVSTLHESVVDYHKEKNSKGEESNYSRLLYKREESKGDESWDSLVINKLNQ